ncbi:hypothetical protein Tco_0201392 [Tanacetum coccineum]
MAEYSQKWHNGTSRTRSTEISNGLAAIQAQLNNFGREIKKVNEKVYDAQVGCELCKGPHYTKDCLLKEEGKTLEEAYYTQFGAPYQPGGQYRALSEIKELQLRPWKFRLDKCEKYCKKEDSKDSSVCNIFSKTVPFPRRLHDYCCDDWKEACELKILETYSIGTTLHDDTLPPKEKGPKKFYSTLAVMVNKSFDPHYGDYIELNDLDVPLEPKMNQDDNFEPTIDENVIVNEPTNKCCYKMKFSCIIRYKHVIDELLPTLSINVMSKHFYNSIIKDEGDHEGKKPAGTLIDIPIFVGNFSIISGFSIIDGMDVTSGVMLGMPFCKKFISCQKIMEKFA